MPRTASFTPVDKKATALARRAQGAQIKQAIKAAGIGLSTYHRIRSDLGAERFDAVLAELRLLYAGGASDAAVAHRAKQLLLGAETTAETAAATEQPLQWSGIETAMRDLFRKMAGNSRGKARERLRHFASTAYATELRTKAAAFLGCDPEELETKPAADLLRAAWVVTRNIEGIHA